MPPLASLTDRVAAQATLEQALSVLLDGLAERMVATSNDQNIHKLARALRMEQPALVQRLVERAGAVAEVNP